MKQITIKHQGKLVEDPIRFDIYGKVDPGKRDEAVVSLKSVNVYPGEIEVRKAVSESCQNNVRIQLARSATWSSANEFEQSCSWANQIVFWDRFGYFEHIVVRACEQFLADARPLLCDVRVFGPVVSELEIPTCPFAIQLTNGIIAGIKHIEGSTYGKEFLLEAPYELIMLIQDCDL